MDIDPGNLPDPPHRSSESERRVDRRKIAAAIVAIVITGALLLPLLDRAHEGGWLEPLAIVFFLVLVIVLALTEFSKQKR